MYLDIGVALVLLTLLRNSSAAGHRHAHSRYSDDSMRGKKTAIIPLLPALQNEVDQGGGGGLLCDSFGAWTSWGRCTRRCEQTRKRHCVNLSACGHGIIKERRPCRRRRRNRRRCSKVSYKVIGFKRRNRLIEEFLYDWLYGTWSKWGPCTHACRRRRIRKCIMPQICGSSYVQEDRRCHTRNAPCQREYSFNSQNSRSRRRPRPVKVKDTTPWTDDRPLSMPPIVERLGEQCGKRDSKFEASYRIVGGMEARRGAWPWQVAILTRWREQYCGGTLITPRWIITAAHCVRRKRRRRKIILRVGEYDFSVKHGTELDIRKVKDFPHPGFDYDTISNDIALLRLKRPLTNHDGVGFACLPRTGDVLIPGTMCYTAGWGKRKNTHPFGADVLRQAQLPVVERKRCQKSFDYAITQRQVCAGYARGGVDSCAGDSGGPLMCSRLINGTVRWFVHGVTSYGEGCGDRGKFGIYTNVTGYLGWIYDTIANN